MIRKNFIISAFLLALCVNFYAQDVYWEIPPKSDKAEKIEDFGIVGECATSSMIDNFFISLQNNPAAKGVIIIYRGANRLPANIDYSLIRMYEDNIRLRRYDRSRVEIIDGGFRQEVTTEIWLVPPGAKMPKPSNTVPKPSLPKNKTFLYELKTSYDYLDEDSLIGYLLPDLKARRKAALKEATTEEGYQEMVEMEAQMTPEETEIANASWANTQFGEMLKKQKNSSGVMVFYADNQKFDITALQIFLGAGKRRIAKDAGISPDRIQIIYGGFRNEVEAELWVVPRNGEFPKFTPEERPSKEVNVENL